MNRRSLLGMLGVGMGIAVVNRAWAQRIRTLPGSGDATSAAGGGTVADDVRRYLEGVRVGDRRAYGGLTVFWLAAPAAPAPFAIATLDEALAKGEFFAAERDAAPRLREQMLAGSDQQKVWAEVNRYAARAAARSATGSYQAIPDKPEVQAKRKDVESCSAATSLRAPGGVAVFVGDALAGIDLFRTIRCSLVSGRSCSAPARSTHTAAGSPPRRRRGCAPRWTRS